MRQPPINDLHLLETAERLCGSRVLSLQPAKAGANSRIFRVETPAGRFALKSYPVRSDDPRNRADVEWKALHFLCNFCGDLVPTPIARDAEGRYLLMEWIEGEPVAPHSPAHVAHAAHFIAQVFAASTDPDASAFPLASEACLSAKTIVDQIEARLAALGDNPAIQAFLTTDFLPALAVASGKLADELTVNGLLDVGSRRLIPADFGFHNAIRTEQGLRYIDFDYFGWDDPVKLIADFVLHPAMNLSAEDQQRFIAAMAPALADDVDWRSRLQRHLPLYALRWVLILFNPFRRDRAAELESGSNERAALIADRMRKARVLMRSAAAAVFAT